jgi:hypothetical protein
MAKASEPTSSPYSSLVTYKYLFVLIAILFAMALLGLRSTEQTRVAAFFLILLLMAAFAVVTGRGMTGHWRGILIDARNKMSLSRLQMLAWTLVVLSTIFTAALTNLAYGWESPMNIEVPSQLWVVMGISTASLVASPAILSNKAQRKANPQAVRAMKKAGDESAPPVGLLTRNSKPQDAEWADLLMGEEVGNASHVDLGKMQLFFFTFILVVGYAAAIAAMFRAQGPVTGLPDVQDGMNVLLGISHTGYLANKTVAHTREAEPPKQA